MSTLVATGVNEGGQVSLVVQLEVEGEMRLSSQYGVTLRLTTISRGIVLVAVICLSIAPLRILLDIPLIMETMRGILSPHVRVDNSIIRFQDLPLNVMMMCGVSS